MAKAAGKQCLVIVGVGLIGGSIGLAARRDGRYSPIVGVDSNPVVLSTARARHCIDEATTDLPRAAKRADIIVACTPVDQIASQILDAAKHCRARTLLTDAGSTKSGIVSAVHAGLTRQRLFVGAHPLAGSEKHGPGQARADLFHDRLTILTITPATPTAALQRASAFWESLGCRLWSMSPGDHDATLAMTSHLPHLVASALAGLLHPGLAGFAATGFRDTTRLAAGDPALWTSILMQNAPRVLDAMSTFNSRFEEYRRALQANDSNTIQRLLSEAKDIRDDLGS